MKPFIIFVLRGHIYTEGGLGLDSDAHRRVILHISDHWLFFFLNNKQLEYKIISYKLIVAVFDKPGLLSYTGIFVCKPKVKLCFDLSLV